MKQLRTSYKSKGKKTSTGEELPQKSLNIVSLLPDIGVVHLHRRFWCEPKDMSPEYTILRTSASGWYYVQIRFAFTEESLYHFVGAINFLNEIL